MLKYPRHFDSFTRPALESKGLAGKICLNKNEAPFSPQEIVPSLDFNLAGLCHNTYPDSYPLYESLASFLGIRLDHLLLTYGSEQAIRYAFELMIESGDEVIYMDPSFAMIDVFACQFRAKKVIVGFDDNLRCPVEAILDRINPKTRLVVIPNPNNPTGTVFSLAELRRLAQACSDMGAMLVADEAYFHYYPHTAQPLVNDFDNVVVTRTFSKAWGLAAARVGYLIAQPRTVDLLRKLKPIDEASGPGIHLCLSVLRHPEILEHNVRQVNLWKQRFASLQGPLVHYRPSEGNFMLLKCSPDAHARCISWFGTHGIMVNGHMPHPALLHHIRLSVGKDACMEKILAQFQGENLKV